MKPDIIKKPYEIQAIEGYVGVFCECGNVLHIKNVPEKQGEEVKIECPCGFEITTVYRRTYPDEVTPPWLTPHSECYGCVNHSYENCCNCYK